MLINKIFLNKYEKFRCDGALWVLLFMMLLFVYHKVFVNGEKEANNQRKVENYLESFISPTKVIIGNDSTKELLSQYRRLFLVTDQFMKESGKTNYITDLLPEGAEFMIYSEVYPDPDTDAISMGVTALMEYHPDIVLALGGGSPIDAAKAMIYFARKKCGMKEVEFVAVPTTSGTGSEVTKFAVITNASTHVKYPLVSDKLLPDVAILDPELTVSVPKRVTADTGIDVLTHAIEAFVSSAANDFTDACAEKAMKLVHDNIEEVYKTPDNIKARQAMHNASCLAGIAFSNAGLGLNHAMAHAIGGKFGLPHGRANGILLPYVMSFNAGCGGNRTPVLRRYAKVARVLELDSTSKFQSTLNLIRHIRSLIKRLEMPIKLKDAGIDEKDFLEVLDELSLTASLDGCLGNNPIEVTIEDIKNVYKNAFYGDLH